MTDLPRHRAVIDPALVDDLTGDAIDLPEEVLHRFRRVLRLDDGAEVAVFDGRGRLVAGELLGTRLVNCVLHADDVDDGFGPVIVQAWTRPKKLEEAVRRATEMGAGGFFIAVCARSQSHPRGDQGAKVAARLVRIAQEAARQSGRTQAPTVQAPQSLAAVLAWQAEQPAPGVRLDTGVCPTLSTVLSRLEHPAKPTLFIGPEGGFDADEQRMLDAAGIQGASLGPTILRTETAAVAAVAVCAASFGRA